tara:strand:+ start:463 stop:636 length:174 start_codon:yes stop_codon:yes gene_type:complete
MTNLQLAYHLMIHSVLKPDPDLRAEAKEAGCYNELMAIRKAMILNLYDLEKRETTLE